MIHVVCLKWGDKYGSEYANRLYRMVNQNLSLPFKFYCITENTLDIDEAINIVPMPNYDLKGWWYKLVIFQENFLNIPAEDKILFLDLDIVILNELDSLVSYSDQFCISADDEAHRYNSSVMCFHPGQYRFIWESFIIQKETIVNEMHGDQDWIEYSYKEAVLFPKSVVKSFKIDLDCKTPYSFGKFGRALRKRFPFLLPSGTVAAPKDAAIVLFHGKPDPADVMDGPYDKYRHAPWIKDSWK
ncbi:MAG: hypothetical protein ISEC1_P1639 [Thiomicrorhabdus sp.]|nr:MAG: hypothetical protein ISEC1_P1639 [Thiomicrorhabdus sp.]